jgi:hypothetical protein
MKKKRHFSVNPNLEENRIRLSEVGGPLISSAIKTKKTLAD